MSLNLDQYVSEFSAQSITGEQLLQLDGNKLKVKNYMSVLGYQLHVLLVSSDMYSSAESVLHNPWGNFCQFPAEKILSYFSVGIEASGSSSGVLTQDRLLIKRVGDAFLSFPWQHVTSILTPLTSHCTVKF